MWYRAELVALAHVSNQANFTVTCTVFFTTNHCYVNDTPRSRLHSGMMSLNPAYKKKNLSPSHTLFKRPIVIQLVQVQLRAFQLQIRGELRIRIDNQARSLPKNTSLALSQLQPIREGTYVAKLHRAPRGYANVQDLPHDLPSGFFIFFYHANHVGVISLVWKSTGILARCVQVNVPLLWERLSNASPNNQHSNFVED